MPIALFDELFFLCLLPSQQSYKTTLINTVKRFTTHKIKLRIKLKTYYKLITKTHRQIPRKLNNLLVLNQTQEKGKITKGTKNNSIR